MSMRPILRCFVVLSLLASFTMPLCSSLVAQPIASSSDRRETKPPYKVLTSGNQVTVKSTRDIKTIMAWTTTGSRILEKTVSGQLYSFRIPTQHKMVFLRIELVDGKTYSEKIGIN